MPMSAMLGGTPYYVLMDGSRRIGPKTVPLLSGIECSTIYGFSDKDPYDNFQLNSQLALTPYPLVKGYLRNQTSATGDGLKLLVIDAAGPRDLCVYAATMEAVLEAQENRMTRVSTAYRLVFDQEVVAYRVEGVSA